MQKRGIESRIAAPDDDGNDARVSKPARELGLGDRKSVV